LFDLFKKKPPEEPSVAQRSWTERLKAGLGLSRDKLAGALTGVFAPGSWTMPRSTRWRRRC
jgi:hypothetical protein